MNLGQVLHTRWAADGTLNGLLDSSKVTTGTYFAEDPQPPYATITRPGDMTAWRDNEGAAEEHALVRITVYHGRDNYDEGLAIADAVKAAFDRTDFALSGSDKVMNIQRIGYEEIDDEDGDWYFMIDFRCQVYLANGV
jgi:hypothetical protein